MIAAAKGLPPREAHPLAATTLAVIEKLVADSPPVSAEVRIAITRVLMTR